MFNFDWLSLLYTLPAVILALTFHEVAHGWVAYRLGDDTAKLSGRLTLNPLAHLDLVGFLMMVFTRFGWAKPVPVNPMNFRGNRKTGMFLVALAGPLTNLCLAYMTALLIRVVQEGWIPYNPYFYTFFYLFFTINLILASFNLIPLPPLDGSKILAGLLPYRFSRYIYSMERYSMLILIVLVFTGILSHIYLPIYQGLSSVIMRLTGIY